MNMSASVRVLATRNACMILPVAARAFHSACARLASENVFSATDMDFDQKVMMVRGSLDTTQCPCAPLEVIREAQKVELLQKHEYMRKMKVSACVDFLYIEIICFWAHENPSYDCVYPFSFTTTNISYCFSALQSKTPVIVDFYAE